MEEEYNNDSQDSPGSDRQGDDDSRIKDGDSSGDRSRNNDDNFPDNDYQDDFEDDFRQNNNRGRGNFRGWRLWRQCHMGLERDCASAWLSTLGGAFSALGDYFDRCAKMALRISMQQIRLSVLGGDPDGVARGWLFLALALSQLGHGNAAFHLLRLAYETPTLDDRHRRMCLGVQAKLKYDRKIRRQKRSEGTLASGDSLAHVLRSITL